MENASQKREAGRFAASVDIEHAGEHRGLIGHDTHRTPFDPPSPQIMLAHGRLDLEKLVFVEHLRTSSLHVIGLARAGRDQRIEARLLAVPRVFLSAEQERRRGLLAAAN